MSPGGAGQTQPLASLLVKFIQTGQAELKTAFDQIRTAIDQVAAAVGKLNADTQAALSRARAVTEQASKATVDLAASWQNVATVLNVSIGAGVATVTGFVRAGMAASAMGQIFSLAMERLSLTMAGLFRPEITKVIQLIDRLTTWFRNLTNEKRAQIAHWIQAAAVAGVLGAVVPRVTTAVIALAAGFKALGAAIGIAQASTGIGALIPLIGLAVQGMAVLLVGTEAGRSALAELAGPAKELAVALKEAAVFAAEELKPAIVAVADAMKDMAFWLHESVVAMRELKRLRGDRESFWGGVLRGLTENTPLGLALFHALHGEGARKEPGDTSAATPRLGGFEDLKRTYERLSVASIAATSLGGKDPAERTADATEAANSWLERIRDAVMNPRPEVAR